jgi:hypothetical protein
MEQVDRLRRSYAFGPPLYLLAFLAAFVDVRFVGNLHRTLDFLGDNHHQTTRA